MYCDASKNDLGCVLMQSERVMAYSPRQLKNHEQNCNTPKYTLVIFNVSRVF